MHGHSAIYSTASIVIQIIFMYPIIIIIARYLGGNYIWQFYKEQN